MHAVGSGFPSHAQDRANIQIRSQRLAGLAHRIALVGLEAMQGKPILVGVDRNRGDAEFGGRSHHADGNLAAIGDQQFGDLARQCVGVG